MITAFISALGQVLVLVQASFLFMLSIYIDVPNQYTSFILTFHSVAYVINSFLGKRNFLVNFREFCKSRNKSNSKQDHNEFLGQTVDGIIGF